MASTSPEYSTNAATKSRSARESSGTSRSTIGRLATRTPPPRHASTARRNNAGRSSTRARSSCSSTRASRRPMSPLASASPGRTIGVGRSSAGGADCVSVSRSDGIPARRSSCTVRARALGKPGVEATGEKYPSSRVLTASNTARAAIASLPACVPGAWRRSVNRVAAACAASSVRLNR